MPSQVEMLKETIAGLEKRLGADAPILKDYRQHLRSLESQQKKPRPNPVTLSVGMQGK